MNCPNPRATRTGEMECPLCGHTGDFEGFDYCPNTILPYDRKARTRLIAERELLKIRAILSRPWPPRRT